LARRTQLNIYGVEMDPAKVALARERLDAAGLYGVRVTIHQGDPARTEYPDYFANLVVSGNSVQGATVPEEEMLRCQRPYGGVACTGKPGSLKKTVRGPLKGAGTWTHQYADSANTICSGDTLVKAPLSVLWFDNPVLGVPNRHGRPPAPLFVGGRLYVQGHSSIRAIDPYNGRLLWSFPIKGIGSHFNAGGKRGVLTTGSNMCTDGKTIFVRRQGDCLRINGETGEGRGKIRLPPCPGGSSNVWGYIAWDGGTLFGSVSDRGSAVSGDFRRGGIKLYSESRALFALDPQTGELRWQYSADNSIRNNAIAIGAGSVFLVDRPATMWGARRPHMPGSLIALDAAAGQEKWSVTNAYGTVLSLSREHNVLVMNYRVSLGKRSRGKGRAAAFRASDGRLLWDVAGWDADARYGRRPVLVGRNIYAGPSAYDLLTGEQRKDYRLVRGYGCGNLASGRHILTFRSSAIGYRALSDTAETHHFGGVRPGCWINAIPAGGLLLVPDFTSGCECRYQMRCSLALGPVN
jgi:outer membrane protein assembly factor BamB